MKKSGDKTNISNSSPCSVFLRATCRAQRGATVTGFAVTGSLLGEMSNFRVGSTKINKSINKKKDSKSRGPRQTKIRDKNKTKQKKKMNLENCVP